MTAEQILKKAKDILLNPPQSKIGMPKEQVEVKLGEVVLEDGTTIYFDDQLVEGASVWTTVNEESVPLPAGEYVLADGSTLVITEAGIVATITPAAGRVEEPVGEAVEAESETAVTKETVSEEVNTNLSADDIKSIILEAIKPLEEKIELLTAQKQEADQKVEELETQLSEEPSTDGIKATPEGKQSEKFINMGASPKTGVERVYEILY